MLPRSIALPGLLLLAAACSSSTTPSGADAGAEASVDAGFVDPFTHSCTSTFDCAEPYACNSTTNTCYIPPACVSDCSARACGDDRCGGSCGTCSGTQTCTAAGSCKANVTSVSCDPPAFADGTAQCDPKCKTINGRYCTKACTGDAQCPSGFACRKSPANFCVPTCNDTPGCQANWGAQAFCSSGYASTNVCVGPF